MDTFNKFAVGVQGDKVTIFNIVGPSRISKDEALNLAAWLVSMADPGGDQFPKWQARPQVPGVSTGLAD